MTLWGYVTYIVVVNHKYLCRKYVFSKVKNGFRITDKTIINNLNFL